MAILDQRAIDAAIASGQSRANRAVERVRAIVYASGAQSAPPGFKNLEGQGDKKVVSDFLIRQANREQMKAQPGDLATNVIQHPAVQTMMQEANQPAPDAPIAPPAPMQGVR